MQIIYLAVSLAVALAYALLAALWWQSYQNSLDTAQILRMLKPFGHPRAVFSVTIEGQTREVTHFMITDIQTGKLVVAFLDSEGNPAMLPSGVTLSYSSDNTAVATVAADPSDPSGATAIVTPNPVAGNLGTCNISVASSDGKLSGVVPCQVVASAAAKLSLSLTAVDPATPAAPAAPTTPSS